VEPLRDRALARLDAIVMNPLARSGAAGVAAVPDVPGRVQLGRRRRWAWITAGMDALGQLVQTALPAGPLRSLLVGGVIAGAGSVLVFLPQILILFFFILLLEDSGYLPRAAFLLDRIMGSVGLSGRSFIPLLSSFSCAIPGIMATRTIPNVRDRLATILLAPMMTCSARLPVYALIIGAFIPRRAVGPFNLQGLVLFALYVAGVAGAVLVALIMRRATMRSSYHPLLMELPEYHWPNLRNLLTGLWERTQIFLTRVGTIILALMVLLWFLASYPHAPAGGRRSGHSLQLRGHDGLGPGNCVQAARIQLADQSGAGAGYSCARSGGRSAGHGVFAVGRRRRRRGARPAAHDCQRLESGYGAVVAGLVCVCAAVSVDAGDRAARNQFLALPAHHDRLSVRNRLRVRVRDLSHCAQARWRGLACCNN
jgi:hypothetical protein